MTQQFVSYGGFWQRLFASLVDNFIVSILIAVFMVVVAATAPGLNLADFGHSVRVGTTVIMKLGLAFGPFIVSWLYKAGMECSSMQATLGKAMLGLKVTDMSGNRISFLRASSRYLMRFFSWLTLGVGFIMVAFSSKKQALHDLIAGCVIVRS